MQARFLSTLPGLRIIPNSTLALAPAAHKATLWPSCADLSALQPWPVGPVVRLHLLPEPHPLIKAGVQRLVTHKLRGCSAAHQVETPFRHHWVLTVRIDTTVPLHERQPEHEAYTLHATRNGITHVHLQAASEWGALLGLQSLRMLLEISHTETQIHAAVHLPATPLEERPAVGHRAVRIPPTLELPEIRHAMDKCAQLKYNVVHWAVLTDGELAQPMSVVRMLVQYAYQRGLQVMFELTGWGDATPAQQKAFLGIFMQLSTAPLVHVGSQELSLPADMPHQLVQTSRQAGTVHEAPLDNWQAGDLVRLPAPTKDTGYRQLADVALPGIRGAAVELPANPLALLQVAALLWSPTARASTHADPRLHAAVAALWYDHGVESTQAHAMDLEALRLREAHNAADGGLIQ
jgi:hypothetical protein